MIDWIKRIFSKQEWRAYIIGGFFVTVLLPFVGNWLLQQYANRSAYNSLVIEQGFKPYQASQLECSAINQDIIRDATREDEDWRLIGKIFNLSKKNNWILSQESRDMLILNLKDSVKANEKFQKDNILFTRCKDKIKKDAENLALFLKDVPTYQKNYITLNKHLNRINKEGIDYSRNAFLKLNIPFPNTIKNIDKLNEILVNMPEFSESFFGDLSSNEAMKKFENVLKINIGLRKEKSLITIRAYGAWQEFYRENDKLFISTLQEHL